MGRQRRNRGKRRGKQEKSGRGKKPSEGKMKRKQGVKGNKRRRPVLLRSGSRRNFGEHNNNGRMSAGVEWLLASLLLRSLAGQMICMALVLDRRGGTNGQRRHRSVP